MNSQFEEVGSDHYKLTSVIAAAEILSQSDFFIFHLFQSKILTKMVIFVIYNSLVIILGAAPLSKLTLSITTLRIIDKD
jgi:hypothetical protein